MAKSSILLSLLVVLCACQGADISDRNPVRAIDVQCKPDKALLAEERSCVLDESCPCGSHCELGVCIASCTKSSECEGGSCDAFGRCSTELGKIPEVGTFALGKVSIEPKVVTLDEDQQSVIYLTGTQANSGQVRIVADDELEVSCDGVSFASSCLIDNLDPESALPQLVDIRVSSLVSDDAVSAQIQVYTETSDQRFDVALLSAPPVPDTTIACAALAAGVYQGSARLVASGTSGALEQEFAGALGDVRIAVSAQIFGPSEGQRVHFTDSHGALFGESGAIGSLSGTSGLSLQSTEYLLGQGPSATVRFNSESNPTINQTMTVDIGADFAPGDWTCRQAQLEGLLDVAFDGLVAASPFLRWEVSMSRSADLPANASAPSLPIAWQRSGNFDVQRPAGYESAIVRLGAREAALARLSQECGSGPTCACTEDGLAPAGFKSEISTAASGDLLCNTASETPLVFPILEQNIADMDSLVESCLADLRDAAEGSDSSAHQCVDTGRLLFRLVPDLFQNRRAAFGNGSPLLNSATNTFVLRQLQQWLSVASFVAQEAKQIDRRNGALTNAGLSAPSYSLDEALLSSINASALVLHPVVAPGIQGMPAGDIANSDYRTAFFAGLATSDPNDTHEQALGLPVAMLRTEATQLASLEGLGNKVLRRQASLGQIAPTYSLVLRNILPALALAQSTYSRMSAPPWQEEWDNAQSQVGAALVAALARFEDARAGNNELGIAPGDLPLGRIGDQNSSQRQFSALSENLLGAPGSNLAIAPAMVERARNKLANARDAWLAKAQRDLDEEFANLAQGRREVAIANEYGGPIVSLCGDPNMETGTVLAAGGDINAETCFIGGACQPTLDEVKGAITSATLSYGLCMHALWRRNAGVNSSASGDPEYDAMADAMPMPLPQPLSILAVSGSADDIAIDVQWGTSGLSRTIHPARVRAPEGRPESVTSNYAYQAAEYQCRRLLEGAEAQRPTAAVGFCETAQDCPVGKTCNNSTCGAPRAQRKDIACYQGTLGEEVLGLLGANQEVQTARAELAELSERYNVAMETCNLQLQGADLLREANEEHYRTMRDLRSAKVVADSVGIAADAAADASDINSIFTFGAKAAAEAAAAAADILALGIQLEMDNASAKHDLRTAQIEAGNAYRECRNEAKGHLVGARSAGARIGRASTEVKLATLRLNNMKRDLDRLVEEGRATLLEEQELKLPAIAGDFWLDENIEEFDTALRQAKRAVYLAVLAAEYEFQFSSPEGDNALAANTPEELAQVVERLRSLTAAGTVGGGSPNNLISVVSLRKQLMQIGDNSNIGPGYYDLSEAERFRLMMVSPSFSVYADDGRYLGQEIPFTVEPLAAGDERAAQGISILSGLDCAERIWSVNASLVGQDLQTNEVRLVRASLRKNKSFFSQWCGSAGPDGSDYQFATSSGRNLFIDPLAFDATDVPQTPSPFDPNRTYVSARLQPGLGVPLSTFKSESYVEGDSQELAGRGLYGDYALFFPAETLAREGSDGLVLANIEDILLRFDYVSVAR